MTCTPVSERSKGRTPTILYITPGFGVGGAEVRTTQIINFLGSRFQHRLVSLNGNVRAAERIDPVIPISWIALPRAANDLVMLLRLVGLVRRERPELVLTFNWGSIDAVLAAILVGTCPVVHTEDGPNIDEAARQKNRRVMFRQILLPYAYRVIAPSQKLANLMHEEWRLPNEKICYLPNGVDTDRFHPQPRPARVGELVIGTVGNLTSVKRQHLLVELCASLKNILPVKLMVVGDGPERASLERQACALGCGQQVVFAGHQADTSVMYQHFDVLGLTSVTEQMPLAVLEAMASGLPIVSTDVGDVKCMVSQLNQPFVVSTMVDFRARLLLLASQPALREQLGQANRARCVAEFSLQRMCEAYATLYDQAVQSGLGSRY